MLLKVKAGKLDKQPHRNLGCENIIFEINIFCGLNHKE